MVNIKYSSSILVAIAIHSICIQPEITLDGVITKDLKSVIVINFSTHNFFVSVLDTNEQVLHKAFYIFDRGFDGLNMDV